MGVQLAVEVLCSDEIAVLTCKERHRSSTPASTGKKVYKVLYLYFLGISFLEGSSCATG